VLLNFCHAALTSGEFLQTCANVPVGARFTGAFKQEMQFAVGRKIRALLWHSRRGNVFNTAARDLIRATFPGRFPTLEELCRLEKDQWEVVHPDHTYTMEDVPNSRLSSPPITAIQEGLEEADEFENADEHDITLQADQLEIDWFFQDTVLNVQSGRGASEASLGPSREDGESHTGGKRRLSPELITTEAKKHRAK
jgi:hypothetical protein